MARAQAAREPVRPTQAVGEAVRTTEPVRQSVRAAQAIRQAVRPAEPIRETVRPSAETVRAASQPIRPPGLCRPAASEGEAVGQSFFRRCLLDRLLRRRDVSLLLGFWSSNVRFVEGFLGPLHGAELLLDHLLDRGVAGSSSSSSMLRVGANFTPQFAQLVA